MGASGGMAAAMFVIIAKVKGMAVGTVGVVGPVTGPLTGSLLGLGVPAITTRKGKYNWAIMVPFLGPRIVFLVFCALVFRTVVIKGRAPRLVLARLILRSALTG